MPCGFGRHAIELAGAGFRVTGVDRSATLLAEARRRAAGARWPKLVQADYRRLPFPDDRFDAALNLFSSLGYLGDEEDTRALAEIRRVLKPGARLVLEIMPRDLLAARFHERDWTAVGDGRLLLEQRAFDVAGGIAQVTQTLIEPDGARESMTYSLRVYATTELLAMARAAASPRCARTATSTPPRRTWGRGSWWRLAPEAEALDRALDEPVELALLVQPLGQPCADHLRLGGAGVGQPDRGADGEHAQDAALRVTCAELPVGQRPRIDRALGVVDRGVHVQLPVGAEQQDGCLWRCVHGAGDCADSGG